MTLKEIIQQTPKYDPGVMSKLSTNPAQNYNVDELQKRNLERVINSPLIKHTFKLLADK